MRFHCAGCLEVFSDVDQLEIHVQHHVEHFPLRCASCTSAIFATTAPFLRHYREIHRGAAMTSRLHWASDSDARLHAAQRLMALSYAKSLALLDDGELDGGDHREFRWKVLLLSHRMSAASIEQLSPPFSPMKPPLPSHSTEVAVPLMNNKFNSFESATMIDEQRDDAQRLADSVDSTETCTANLLNSTSLFLNSEEEQRLSSRETRSRKTDNKLKETVSERRQKLANETPTLVALLNKKTSATSSRHRLLHTACNKQLELKPKAEERKRNKKLETCKKKPSLTILSYFERILQQPSSTSTMKAKEVTAKAAQVLIKKRRKMRRCKCNDMVVDNKESKLQHVSELHSSLPLHCCRSCHAGFYSLRDSFEQACAHVDEAHDGCRGLIVDCSNSVIHYLETVVRSFFPKK